jgi:uncharacterized protein YndB with AHSA1/START domain
MTATTASNPASNAAAKSGDREITATRVFDAPRELVFKLWTEPEHVAQWWGPRGFTNTIHEMDVRPGGVWRFVMHGPDGTDYLNKVIYEEVVAPERLVYKHVSGPVFRATATFDQEGSKTKVTMTMTFETAAERDKTAKDFGAVEGLGHTFDRLEEQLAKSGAFIIKRTFEAPRDLMFEVWTDTKHLQNWFGPKGFTTIHAKNDFREGGEYHYALKGPDGNVMWGKWMYREIVPPKRLVFLNAFSDEAGGLTRHPLAPDWPQLMLSTISFDENDGKTTVTIEWAPFRATEAEQKTFDAGRPGMTQGWTGTFEQLEAYLPTVKR